MIKCAVNGQRRPGYMCGSIIVGNKTCGFEGACEHQRISDQSGESTNKVDHDCAGAQHHRYAGSFSE